MGSRRNGSAAARAVAVAVCALLAGGCASDDPPEGEPATSPVSGEPRGVSDVDALAPLLVTAVEPAVPFKGSNGRFMVSYELRLLNPTPLELTPTEVKISDPDGKVVETMSGDAVAVALGLPSQRSGVGELTEGQVGTLYVTLAFDSESDIPAKLDHEVTVTADRLPPGGVTSTPPTTVDVDRDLTVPVLGPPLEAGRGYVAADSCCSSERHRRALLPIGDRQWLAQRFAVDWQQLDRSGRTVRKGGDPSDPNDYAIFGTRAIAAADATVIHVVDGLPEQTPGELPDGMTLPKADGNSIVADIGDGLYMLYAHLQAGSIEVEVGDEIERGDRIGLVGNTGNSSAPHLHFHVMDGPSPLLSEGVPYVVDAFATTGRIRSTEAFDRLENTDRKIPVDSGHVDDHRDELPLDLTIVDFP